MTVETTPNAAVLGFLPAEVRSVALVGEGVAGLVDALARSRRLSIASEGERFALMSEQPGEVTAGRLREVPEGSANAVILRRAWRGREEVAAALAAACSALAGGGLLVAADLDVSGLLGGSDARYPSRALYRALPGVRQRLESETLPPMALSTDAVRAGFREVSTDYFDETRGVFPSVLEYWAALRSDGWRGDAWLEGADRDRLFEEAGGALHSRIHRGEIVDREPWYAVTGTRG